MMIVQDKNVKDRQSSYNQSWHPVAFEAGETPKPIRFHSVGTVTVPNFIATIL